MFKFASQPSVSNRATSFNTWEVHQHTDSNNLASHALTWCLVDDLNWHSLPLNNIEYSATCDSTVQAVDAVYGDHIPLTQQTLHHHNKKTKPADKERLVQY